MIVTSLFKEIHLTRNKKDWNRKKPNLQLYSEEYHRLEKTTKGRSEKDFRSFLLLTSIQYKIHEILEQEPTQIDLSFGRVDVDTYIPPNPKDIVLPEEPTPIIDLQPFKESTKKQITEYEKEIETLRAETLRVVAISQQEPFLMSDGYWLYQDTVYEVKGGHSDDEKKLLILEFADKERNTRPTITLNMIVMKRFSRLSSRNPPATIMKR